MLPDHLELRLKAAYGLRMLPAFLYFLAMSSISDLDLQAVGQQIGALPLTPVLWGILLIGAAVFTICMLISARKH